METASEAVYLSLAWRWDKMASTSSLLFLGDRREVTKVDSADSKHLFSETQAREDHSPRGFHLIPQLCRRATQAGLAQLTISIHVLISGMSTCRHTGSSAISAHPSKRLELGGGQRGRLPRGSCYPEFQSTSRAQGPLRGIDYTEVGNLSTGFFPGETTSCPKTHSSTLRSALGTTGHRL